MRRLPLALTLSLLLPFLGACGGRPVPPRAATEAAPTPTQAVAASPIRATATRAAEPTVAAAPSATPSPTATVAPTVSANDPLAATDPTGQTVRFWHPYTGTVASEVEALAQGFNESNPFGIVVEPEGAGDFVDLYARMMTALAAGSAPNLVVAYQDQAAAYRQQDGLADLAPWIESARWGIGAAERADFFAAFVNGDFNPQTGEQLGFPLSRSMEVLVYNADLLAALGFAAPPADWDALEAMACAASEAGNTGLALNSNSSRFAALVFSHGGDLLAGDGSGYTLDSPAAIESMERLQSLTEQGCATLSSDPAATLADFGAGTLLFWLGSSAELPAFGRATQGLGEAWGVAAVPHTTAEPVQAIYGASLSVVRASPEADLAAWLFVRWLAEPQPMTRWAQSLGEFPARRSVAARLDNPLADAAFQSALPLLPYGKAEPPVAGYDQARGLISEALVAIAGGAPVADTLATLNEAANATLIQADP